VLHLLFAAAPAPAPEAAASAPPSVELALAGLGVALFLVLALWEIAGHASTIAHEGAHAAGFVLFGRGVRSVTIDLRGSDHVGETTSAGGPLSVLAGVLGYWGPALFGLLGAALLMHGPASSTLWVYVALLGLLLVVTRNLFGFCVVLTAGGVLGLTAAYGSPTAQSVVACAWVWLLLLVGVVFAFGHFIHGDDYRALREATLLPRTFWSLLTVIVSLGALYVAGSWLLGFSRP
jgi:hypothetical protein